MVTDCKLIFLTPPALERSAREQNLPSAHLAYRVGGGPHLFRANLPVAARGGSWPWTARASTAGGSPPSSARRSCGNARPGAFREYTAPFPTGPSPCSSGRWPSWGKPSGAGAGPFMCPRSMGPPRTTPACSSQRPCRAAPWSSGWPRRLRSTARPGWPCGVERLAQDFLLPSPTGQGAPLSRQALAEQLEQRGGSVFFSHELCAHYFTYMTKTDGAHFVLFDDAGSIRKKCQLGARLGITHAFVPYAQVDDLLPGLLE